MPWSSRTTSTRAARRGRSTRPVVCGKGLRTSWTAVSSAATSTTTTATAAYDASRAARGQPRNRRHQPRGGWSLSVLLVMVQVIVPCRTIGTRQGRVPAAAVDRRRTVPTYQYACTECGHAFEQFQSFSDNALTECPECSGRLRKVFNAVGVVFKGSGFYRTDSRSGSADG